MNPSSDGRADMTRKLAKVVLGFQDLLRRDSSPAMGLLCQVFLPQAGPHGTAELTTKVIHEGQGQGCAAPRCRRAASPVR